MWKYITKPLSTPSKKKQKQKQKKYFSNKNKKCQEGRQIIPAALASFGKLLKGQSQHGEPNRAGKDYWHPKWCVIMGCSFHISAVNTSGPQTAKKNSCRSNHGVRYCTFTGLNGSFRSHQISESNNQHVPSCPEFNTRG